MKNSQEKAYNAAKACIEGGLKIIEITLNTAGAIEIIQQLRENYKHILIGAGTVLDVELAGPGYLSRCKVYCFSSYR